MLQRILEVEAMETPEEARDYDAMGHSIVNRIFVQDASAHGVADGSAMLDVGTGTALIPIEFCEQHSTCSLVAIDLAAEMLKLAAVNIERAGFAERIKLEQVDGKRLHYAEGTFAAVVSNSIIHHIPTPAVVFAEMHRVCADGGKLFVRDLRRPETEEELLRLVALYADGANAHQRQLFTDSLYAALTLDEVRAMVGELGYAENSVVDTSDRHWTWRAKKPAGTRGV